MRVVTAHRSQRWLQQWPISGEGVCSPPEPSLCIAYAESFGALWYSVPCWLAIKQWYSSFLPCRLDGQGPVHPQDGSSQWARSSHTQGDRSIPSLIHLCRVRRYGPAPTYLCGGKWVWPGPNLPLSRGRRCSLAPIWLCGGEVSA